jgi:hypothetical protein
MMMTRRLFSSLLAPVMLASACSPSFESDLDEVEIIQHGLNVPAAPAASRAGNVSVTATLTISSSGSAWTKQMNSDVFVHRVSITGGGSLPDLDFIQSVQMTVAAGEHPESAIAIMNYVRGPEAPSGLAIQVDPPTPIDITTPWNASKTVISSQLVGDLPAQGWTMDVAMTLSGKIVYEY